MSKTTYAIGVFLGVFGLAGMAEAITGHGSFMVAAIVFSVGFAICMVDLMKGVRK